MSWSADQNDWPEHLRDNAPSQRCSRCGRVTVDKRQFGREDRMVQPDGSPCGGRFGGASDDLDDLRDTVALLRFALEKMAEDRHERLAHGDGVGFTECSNPVCNNTVWILRRTEVV